MEREREIRPVAATTVALQLALCPPFFHPPLIRLRALSHGDSRRGGGGRKEELNMRKITSINPVVIRAKEVREQSL